MIAEATNRMIYTRPYLKQRIAEEKARSLRTDSPFAFVLLDPKSFLTNGLKPRKPDIDKFMNLLKEQTRETDVQGWWDGKTYAILMLDTPPESCFKAIEKITENARKVGLHPAAPNGNGSLKVYSFPEKKRSLKQDSHGEKDKGDSDPGERASGQASRGGGIAHMDLDPRWLPLSESRPLHDGLKRIVDILASAIGLVLLSPVFALLALLIKLDSSGPVLYRQPRVGKGGRLFTFYKFRSMRQDCDQKLHEEHIKGLVEKKKGLSCLGQSEKSYKLPDDNRVTRMGQFLRKTSIDELPQLINVLRGDMTLVGPRPHPVYEVNLYIPWWKYRLDVKPGITGLGQVDGRYNREYEDVYRLDLRYLRKRSFLMDLKILFKTFLVVFTCRGAC